jgi:hypothetical protein
MYSSIRGHTRTAIDADRGESRSHLLLLELRQGFENNRADLEVLRLTTNHRIGSMGYREPGSRRTTELATSTVSEAMPSAKEDPVGSLASTHALVAVNVPTKWPEIEMCASRESNQRERERKSLMQQQGALVTLGRPHADRAVGRARQHNAIFLQVQDGGDALLMSSCKEGSSPAHGRAMLRAAGAFHLANRADRCRRPRYSRS